MTDPDLFSPLNQMIAVTGTCIVLFLFSIGLFRRQERILNLWLAKGLRGMLRGMRGAAFWLIRAVVGGPFYALGMLCFLWIVVFRKKEYLVILSLIWFVFYAFVQVSYTLLAPLEERSALARKMERLDALTAKVERMEKQGWRAHVMAEVALYGNGLGTKRTNR